MKSSRHLSSMLVFRKSLETNCQSLLYFATPPVALPYLFNSWTCKPHICTLCFLINDSYSGSSPNLLYTDHGIIGYCQLFRRIACDRKKLILPLTLRAKEQKSISTQLIMKILRIPLHDNTPEHTKNMKLCEFSRERNVFRDCFVDIWFRF